MAKNEKVHIDFLSLYYRLHIHTLLTLMFMLLLVYYGMLMPTCVGQILLFAIALSIHMFMYVFVVALTLLVVVQEYCRSSSRDYECC